HRHHRGLSGRIRGALRIHDGTHPSSATGHRECHSLLPARGHAGGNDVRPDRGMESERAFPPTHATSVSDFSRRERTIRRAGGRDDTAGRDDHREGDGGRPDEPAPHPRRLPRLRQRRGADGAGGTPSRTCAARPRLKASISRRFIVAWATAHSSSSGETTRASSPGRISGSASRTNFAKTFFPSRWNGTASSSTTIRSFGAKNALLRRRAPAAFSVNNPSSARRERTCSPLTWTLRIFPVFFDVT